MNIILQNYKNLINKLMNDSFINKIDPIINIFHSLSIENKKNYLSRQTIRNIILKENLAIPKITKLTNVDSLYIIVDEKWIPTQNNNHKKVMQKSIVIFDGFKKVDKRKYLNI